MWALQVFVQLKNTQRWHRKRGRGGHAEELTQDMRLYLPHELDQHSFAPPHTDEECAHVYVSQHNPQALEVLRHAFDGRPEACASRSDIEEPELSELEPLTLASADVTGRVAEVTEGAPLGSPAPLSRDPSSTAAASSRASSSLPGTIFYTQQADPAFMQARRFFVFLTKQMFEDAQRTDAEGIEALRQLRALIAEAEELLELSPVSRQQCQLVCFYEADARSALMSPKGGGTTFDELLELWKSFDEDARMARKCEAILALRRHHKERHPSRYDASAAAEVGGTAAGGDDGGDDDDDDVAELEEFATAHSQRAVKRRALTNQLFLPLFSDDRHPHRRVTVKLLAEALFDGGGGRAEWCSRLWERVRRGLGAVDSEARSALLAEATRRRIRQQRARPSPTATVGVEVQVHSGH